MSGYCAGPWLVKASGATGYGAAGSGTFVPEIPNILPRQASRLLVRYLVQDDPRQSALATKYIERQCTVENPCFIGQITTIIEQLLQVGQLEVMHPDVDWRALTDYKASNVDLPDHLVARIDESRGCDSTLTFDEKAAKQPMLELLK